MRSRRMLVFWAVLLVVAIGLCAVDVGLGIALIAYMAVVILGLPLLLRIRLTRLLRRTLTPGTELWSGFGADAFATRGPLGANEYSYASLRSIRRADGAVLVRPRHGTMLYGFPTELFPEHELARVQAAVARGPR
ncbi:hypothetical protein ACFT5B_05995 [Luteimicrobium sp. NPDC057192]|uniref:hypothetical protein n=1 Tax=Luteimicrobium sp. NPDC057192 TaxID=3346042 RepID=UPI00363A94DD